MISSGNHLSVVSSWFKRVARPGVPKHLIRNFKRIDRSSIEEVTASLKRHYFSRLVSGHTMPLETYLSTEEGKADLLNHVEARLNAFRRDVIPWLDDAKPLSGVTILEIGCGTGSSTVALAEQGLRVTAVDIDEASLAVARDRCKAHGLNIDFLRANATDVHRLLSGQRFDFIIFFACLEHMTQDERLLAMSNTWGMLSKNDLWCMTDTPNRLWFFDGHTSWLPFFLWLPDDLAFKYSRFSPRLSFRETHLNNRDDAMLEFLRHGRGVSFHELDLAIGRSEELDVVSSLSVYRSKHNPLWSMGRRLARTRNYRYQSFLGECGPNIHEGFYQPSLDLIIRKH